MDAVSRQRVRFVASANGSRTLQSAGSQTQPRLVIASNRIGQPGQTHAGGLASAMLALLARRRGTWMGWSGQVSSSHDVDVQTVGTTRYITWALRQRDFRHYYRDMANRALWPLLHARTDLLRYHQAARDGYLQVNRLFADRVAAELEPQSTLWVHDYHLIPLAAMLRERGVRNRIGFFLHTPLPAARLLATLPGHRELFGTFAAYDLIGLQTAADAHALREYFRGELGASGSGDVLRMHDGASVRIAAFPIGIDPEAMAAMAESAAHDPDVIALRESLGERMLLIGVDRQDYSKGLPQRLQAFGRMLDLHPELHRMATLLQVTPESRREVSEYRELGREVQQLVGRINGRHANAAWTPVRYVNQGYPQSVLAGFYRLARVALVTPLRDGMNLVAKEFLACQRPDDPGVLVLSEFAGAAEQLGHCALLVNPLDIDHCARTIASALQMPLSERRLRWRAAMRILERGSVHAWCDSFLAALEHAPIDTLPAALADAAPPPLPDRRDRVDRVARVPLTL